MDSECTSSTVLGNLMVMMRTQEPGECSSMTFLPNCGIGWLNWLESEHSWCLEESVEMSLDDEDANVYKSYE